MALHGINLVGGLIYNANFGHIREWITLLNRLIFFLCEDIRKIYTLLNWNETQIKISEPSGQKLGCRIRKNGVLCIGNINILHN